MSNGLLNTVVLGACFLLLFASAEWLYHKRKVKAELTRKYVHMVTGLLTMLFPVLLGNHWFVMILCASFLVLLLTSLKFGFWPSINGVDRVTRGSILYPIVVYFCFLVYARYDQLMFFYIPILILAISDPIAALVGNRWPLGRYTIFKKTKTLSGSSGFFVSAVVICVVAIIGFEEKTLSETALLSVAVALVSTIAEAVTHKGYDNLTVPAGALLVLILMKNTVS